MEVGKNKEGYAYVGEGYKNKENAAHASDYILKAHMRSDTKEGLHVAVDQINFRGPSSEVDAEVARIRSLVYTLGCTC